MNDTRKAIIELIEPYMEKESSEGCYILYDYDYLINIGYFSNPSKSSELKTKEKIYKLGDTNNGKYYSGIDGNDINFYFYKGYDETEESESIEIKKILGHYDISAVLKYIEKNNHFILMKIGISQKLDNIVFWEGEDGTEEIGYEEPSCKIPNKPLHLYTEQEEKDLLQLLQKLN